MYILIYLTAQSENTFEENTDPGVYLVNYRFLIITSLHTGLDLAHSHHLNEHTVF